MSLGPKNVFLIYEMIALNYDQYLYEPNQMPPQSWDSRGDSALIYYKRSVDESIKEGAFSIMQLGVEYINDLCDHKRRLTGLDCSEVLGVERYSDFLSQSYMALNVKDIESTILAEEKESMENIARAEKQNLNRLSNNRLMWGGALLISGLIFSIILLTVQKKRLLSRMQTLRSQINPHFMNNSLNAIESLIIQDKKKEASKYLVHFSRLTRKMLDSSRKPMTSLKDELDTLKHFLALEQLRFRDKFSYTIEISPEIDTGQVQFPAVLLQPYVENAILHGIKPLEGKGHLSIKIEKLGKTLKVSIQDNGIGRTASAAIKAQSNRSEKRISHAMKINEERIQMLKKNKKTKVEIIDLYDEYQNSKGTLVSIQLPFKTIKT
ncbi:MAG: histidine kinase [Bacteroidota bacterium]